ncbi:MAG: hypothetical protein HFE63_07980 [Clostridiales bacterium]|nr:hypothetical protein [Clostridiales bacterium]
MGFLYGVSGETPANTKLTNGYDLFSWVMRMSSVPAFWGRSMTGRNQLTLEEIEFLHSNRCGIALIFNALTETDVSALNGIEDGLRAANAAKALGVPTHNGIAVFAEIHDEWSVNHNWMISYAYALLDSGYIPGFIANTDSSKNFNFGRQCSHYADYMGDIARSSTVYWATAPKLENEPFQWDPYCPSQLKPTDMNLWRIGSSIKYGDEISVAKNYIRDESNTRFLWKHK